jgi:hypothetical protein
VTHTLRLVVRAADCASDFCISMEEAVPLVHWGRRPSTSRPCASTFCILTSRRLATV